MKLEDRKTLDDLAYGRTTVEEVRAEGAKCLHEYSDDNGLCERCGVDLMLTPAPCHCDPIADRLVAAAKRIVELESFAKLQGEIASEHCAATFKAWRERDDARDQLKDARDVANRAESLSDHWFEQCQKITAYKENLEKRVATLETALKLIGTPFSLQAIAMASRAAESK